jgi:orotate phosphoribosyltransferase
MTLFQQGKWTLHAGGVSLIKVECDALTNEDIETLAWLIAHNVVFSDVYGVPHGGKRLEAALRQYIMPEGVRLIVDDVLTTGTSMEEAKRLLQWDDAVGVVVFARGKCPQWISPIFTTTWLD